VSSVVERALLARVCRVRSSAPHALPRFCVATMMKHSRFGFGRTRSRGPRSSKQTTPPPLYFITAPCSFGLLILVCPALPVLYPQYMLFPDGGLKQKNKGGASRIRMDLLGYGLTWPSSIRELQGRSLSQVQVFLIRVLVFALRAASMSQPIRGGTVRAWSLELELGTGRKGSAVYGQKES
jgi:hypothetical protein